MKTVSQLSEINLKPAWKNSDITRGDRVRQIPTNSVWQPTEKLVKKYLKLRSKNYGPALWQIITRKYISQETAKDYLYTLVNSSFIVVLDMHQLKENEVFEVNRYVKLSWVHEFSQRLHGIHEDESYEFAKDMWHNILLWCLQNNIFYLPNNRGKIYEKNDSYCCVLENHNMKIKA